MLIHLDCKGYLSGAMVGVMPMLHETQQAGACMHKGQVGLLVPCL